MDVPPAPPAKTIEQPTVREMPTPPPPPEPQAEPEVRAQVTPPQPPQPPEPVPQPEPLTDIARVPDVPPTQSIDEPRPPVAPPAQTETVPASPATEPTATQQPSTANDTATPSPTAPQRTAKLDFGWLTERLTGQVAQAIRYPADARLNAWEGKVVVKVTVTAAGDLIDASVVRSSGHESLDQEALALLRRLSPLTLDRPLGKDRISLHLPIRFSLH
ncbi:MAG: TonB family protein [Nitrospiraceae bacterium]